MLLTSLLVVGCSTLELEPGAHAILVSPNKPPQDCKYVGHIIGKHERNLLNINSPTKLELEKGAMNDLKNQAHRLSANYVDLTINSPSNTTAAWSADGDNVAYSGNAYRCP